MPGIIKEGNTPEETGTSEIEISPQTNKNTSNIHSSPTTVMTPSELLATTPGPTGQAGPAEPSIEQLYNNVCEMESSGSDRGSPSRESFNSDGDESRIDSELRHLVGGEMEAVRVIEEEDERENNSISNKQSNDGNIHNVPATPLTQFSNSPVKVLKKKGLSARNSIGSIDDGENGSRKSASRAGPGRRRLSNGTQDQDDDFGLDNPDLGPFLLKHARDLIVSDNPRRALKYALRAAKSFEKCARGKPSLNLAMSLHVVAAIYCSLGQYAEAVPVLTRSLEIPVIEEGQDHALAKFSGYMQLGDTYGLLGQLDAAIDCYKSGLEIQKETLGSTDPRVGETCRYLAEAHVQALQFDEAKKMCLMALDIHRESFEPASADETADRRLMGLICDTMGDHEEALEHLVLSSMAMVSGGGQETEVASIDSNIGDIYLSLGRYDEAVFAYQKALTVFKTSKGENHTTVASVFVRLADLYNKTGKLRESKSYCENALRIYQKPVPGTSIEEIASGLTDVAAIYESMNEHEQALKLLQKALKMYNNSSGQQSTIAGIEAQMGVLYYILGNYGESYNSFKGSIAKMRASGEKKSAFFGVALNQMGLACVQRYAINEAAELFEEARTVLEKEYGPYHPDTLGVYSNLAGTYDAMGRLDEAIEILEHVVGMREEKLGTANPDVDDEKKRLAELLKEAGRVRTHKALSLFNLLDANPNAKRNEVVA
ncbi:Tetratricopeptide repeat (TPR)-like superfamily protein [Rhynchospora pubera]|uniref:Tetratricopeptide repeat (TPR)-like superfamily protein n=1 Tax=Rhynchospora pubera TaxID=906938 RepID=A0AAV8DKX2_9POAL|nr:Tetratricopeptide repeat (TPR)-like superfamily protein [Rhynchospora pubera]